MSQRLFFALWLPDAAATALDRAVDPIRAHSPPWLRWQPRERWHITVCFLGDRDEAEGDEIRSAATHSAASVAAGELRLHGSGHFGAVLWVGVEHGPWLRTLARRLNRAMVPHDERRGFNGHVTVARARDRRRPPRTVLTQLSAHSGPPWQPDRLALVASDLGPQPRYTTVQTWPLRPGRP